MAQTTNTHRVTFGDRNTNCGNTDNSVNTTIYNSDQDARIMRWLSPLEPDDRHNTVRTNRHEGVGDWLLELKEWKKWREGEGGADEAVFFCSGNPGVGKTHLSSLVIDRLRDEARDGGLAVAWLYCDYLGQQEQTVINVLGAILKGLVGRREIPKEIVAAFQEGRRPLLADLKGMLKTAIDSLPQVFICIDALDEYLPRELPVLLESLRGIVRESPMTRIFLTGRPPVREAIQRYFTRAIVIPVSPNQDDIRNYVEMKLDRDDEPEAMDDVLRADIVKTILAKMSDIFLLVSLIIDVVLGEVTKSQRRKKLEAMGRGNGLGDAYKATLARLKAQRGNKSVLGLNVLMWVLYSRRPLSPGDLCQALGVVIRSEDLDQDNVPALKTLLSSCLGLVTVEASSSTVRLMHFTLQEHLSNDLTLFHNPDSTIAEVCLTYLNFRYVRDLTLEEFDYEHISIPLLDYASCYWGEHARTGMTENAKLLSWRLLDSFGEHISAALLLSDCEDGLWVDELHEAEGQTGFTGLHVMAFFGIVEILAAVLEMRECDVNARDCCGRTALLWAAKRGHGAVVKKLLEQEDIDLDQGEESLGRTPLMHAAMDGHEGVVKMLLEREDVNPNVEDTLDSCTALSFAADYGHMGVVKILLERQDVSPNVNMPYSEETLPLWVVNNGDEELEKLLLQRENLDPNTVDHDYGGTLLWWAVSGGGYRVLKLLLERQDVDPNNYNIVGQTPLSFAAGVEDEVMIKMLLEREDVDPNLEDTEYGRTPLSIAVREGHEGVVRMLLEREDINPGRADKCSKTPLIHAAVYGYDGVVKMLLERDDVNPNQADTKYGRTPLLWAALNGCEGAVKVLLQRPDVSLDTIDLRDGWTPLLLAARSGNEGIVKMLLSRKDVNPNQADTKYGRTPLLWAASGGRNGVVRMLLERQDVKPHQLDTKYGQAPLSWAARNGHEAVVKMLLERDDAQPDQPDTKYGQTPLLWATRNGHEKVVKILLERGDVNPNKKDTLHGRTPLSCAAENGHEGLVKLFLERKDTNPDHVDTTYGRAPLDWAVLRGHKRVLNMLSERQDLPESHKILLFWAAESGRTWVMNMLSGRGNLDPSRVGAESGETLLLWAARNGHEGPVKMLLEREDANPDQVDVINHRRPAYTILRVLEDARTTPEDSPDLGIR